MRRIERHIWLGAGIVLFALGTIGIFLPIMPTVVFYLAAAWCFSRSHPQWAERLHNHPIHGHHLRAWRDRRAISRRGKVSALVAMSASIPFTWFVAGWPWVLIPVGVLVVVGPWILTRPE